MKRFLTLIPLLIVTAAAYAGPSPATQKAFANLKKLVGTWEDKGQGGMEVTVTYKITGAGSAVVETQFPGQPHEMVTVYHLDGDDLILTHYCAAGNQPTMKFVPGKDPNVLSFNFLKGSNMKPKDAHMHSVKIRFISENQVQSDWTSFSGGKAADTVHFKLKRVK